jgi:hypothetical protein
MQSVYVRIRKLNTPPCRLNASITWDIHAGHRGNGKASHFDRGRKCSRPFGKR